MSEPVPVVYAHDCDCCPVCEEPVCPSCELHYFECPCPGPDSTEDFDIVEEDGVLVGYPKD